jgi:hypothetical protein
VSRRPGPSDLADSPGESTIAHAAGWRLWAVYVVLGFAAGLGASEQADPHKSVGFHIVGGVLDPVLVLLVVGAVNALIAVARLRRVAWARAFFGTRTVLVSLVIVCGVLVAAAAR